MDKVRRAFIKKAYKITRGTNIAGRVSSITNAFVTSILPVVRPTAEEIVEGLAILGMVPENIRCVYCGNPYNVLDHLYPIVSDSRATGYYSEIANLVPACSQCNSSKGSDHWRTFLLKKTNLNQNEVLERIGRLDAYENWRKATKLDIPSIIGPERWEHLWLLSDGINKQLREAQAVAGVIRSAVNDSMKSSGP
jgi:hypothetical protein